MSSVSYIDERVPEDKYDVALTADVLVIGGRLRQRDGASLRTSVSSVRGLEIRIEVLLIRGPT